MSNSVIEYKVLDGVANICLSRPKQYNSLNGELRQNFIQILDKIEKDISIRVVIISGAYKVENLNGIILTLEAFRRLFFGYGDFLLLIMVFYIKIL